MRTTNKFNVIGKVWKHQLEGGGWEWTCSHIVKEFHSPESKIKMFTAYEYQVREYIFEYHLAWFHQVLTGYERSLENLVNSTFWKNNTRFLLHAFTVSKYQEEFLRQHGLQNISTIYHPTPLRVPRWNWNKFNQTRAVYHIGLHCRNVNFFVDLAKSVKSNFSFNYLVPKNDSQLFAMPPCIKIVPRVDPGKYQDILESSVVFMNLTDATANNTILECLARGTPVILNPIGGVKEYLGENYPLYYNSLKEAEYLIDHMDNNLLNLTQKYLLTERQKFSIGHFTNSLQTVLGEINYEF